MILRKLADEAAEDFVYCYDLLLDKAAVLERQGVLRILSKSFLAAMQKAVYEATNDMNLEHMQQDERIAKLKKELAEALAKIEDLKDCVPGLKGKR